MSDLTERELGAQLKREAEGSFAPNSYGGGLERRVKRHVQWASEAREAARQMLDGTPDEKRRGEQWWRDHLDQPRVVLSQPEPAPHD